MRKMIDLLDEEQCAVLQKWADAAIAVFSSALLVSALKGIVDLVFG